MIQTDLESVKSEALIFLYLTPVRNETIPVLVSHPFFNSSLTMDDEKHELVDIIEDEQAMSIERNRFKQRIQEAANVAEVEMWIQRAYKLVFLKFIEPYLSTQDLGNYLAKCLVTLECIGMDANVSKEEIVGLIRKCNKSELMGHDDWKIFNQLGHKVKIYRGLNKYNLNEERSLCWTTKASYARYYAKRFGGEGKVVKAEVNKDDILVFFNHGGGRNTVIVDPSKITEIRNYILYPAEGEHIINLMNKPVDEAMQYLEREDK